MTAPATAASAYATPRKMDNVLLSQLSTLSVVILTTPFQSSTGGFRTMNLHISVLPCGRRKKASGSVQRGLVRVGHGPVNTTTVQREVEVLIQSHHGPCIVELATIVRGAEQGDLGTPHRNRRTLCGQPAEHATRFLLPKKLVPGIRAGAASSSQCCGHRANNFASGARLQPLGGLGRRGQGCIASGKLQRRRSWRHRKYSALTITMTV